jgi:hypothetical protein
MSEEAGAIHFYAGPGHGKLYQRQNFELLYFSDFSGRLKLQEQPMANLTRVDDVSSIWTIQDTDSEFTMFDFRQIVESTDNFCNENKLGQGGFGAVYKVVCYHEHTLLGPLKK